MGAFKCNEESVLPGRRACVVFELSCRLGRVARGVLWLVTASMRCPAQEFCALGPVRRLANVWRAARRFRRCSLCNARGHSHAATPHHFTTASHPGSPCGRACAEAPCPARRVQPNPNPIGQKFVSSPPSIIIAKAPPFARCTLKTFDSSVAHRCCGCPSLLRLPRGCKNHHGSPPAQRAPHGPRGNV